jgi:4-hydroxy-tetrahydrodipicolinate reductase
MIQVVVSGARGKMGRTVVEAVQREEDLDLVGEVDLDGSLRETIERTAPDVVVDFTHPSCAVENTRVILECGSRPVIGTTGFKPADIEGLQRRAAELKRGGLIAPNFAIGAVLLMRFAAEAARFLPAVEIIELHHDQKADAPSGTAIKTAEAIARAAGSREPRAQSGAAAGARGALFQGIPIHSVRLPGLVAHEEVLFGGVGQLLTIRHDSLSRESFMSGVVLACRKVLTLERLAYGLEELL